MLLLSLKSALPAQCSSGRGGLRTTCLSPRHFSASPTTGHLPVPPQKPPTLILNTVKSSELSNFLQRSLQLSAWSELRGDLWEVLESVPEGRGEEEEDLLACRPSSPPAPAHAHLSLFLSFDQRNTIHTKAWVIIVRKNLRDHPNPLFYR